MSRICFSKLLLCIFFVGLSMCLLPAMPSVDSSLADEYFELGQSYAENKNYKKAIYFYKKASSTEAFKNASLYNMAKMYGMDNQWNESVKILQQLYNQSPDNKKIYVAYAYSLVASGDIKKGCEIYNQIYIKEPDNPEAHINYIKILIIANKYDEAEKIIESSKLKFTGNEEQNTFNQLKEKLTKVQNPEQKN